MDKKTKIIWTLLGLAGLGLGTGIAMYLYNRQNPKEKKAVEVETDDKGIPSLDATVVVPVSFSTDAPKDSESIKSFQTWVNTVKKPNPLLKVDGIWGVKSQAQWDLYSKDYAKRNRTISSGGSQLSFDTPLWIKGETVNVYSYPKAEQKYLLGYAKRSANMFARFKDDSSVGGWIKVKSMYNELSGGKLVASIAYVQLKDVTTVAP